MIDLFFQSFAVTFGALMAIGVAFLICSVASLLFDWITGKLSPENLAAIFLNQAMRDDLKKDLKDGACAGGFVGCPGGETCTSDHK